MEVKMARKPPRRRSGDPIERELESIRRLLVLLLLKAGTPQSELALALKMDRGDVSRMVPARKVKQFTSGDAGAD
jgi:hypothetical protein